MPTDHFTITPTLDGSVTFQLTRKNIVRNHVTLLTEIGVQVTATQKGFAFNRICDDGKGVLNGGSTRANRSVTTGGIDYETGEIRLNLGPVIGREDWIEISKSNVMSTTVKIAVSYYSKDCPPLPIVK